VMKARGDPKHREIFELKIVECPPHILGNSSPVVLG
jgi:hypothetical protein